MLNRAVHPFFSVVDFDGFWAGYALQGSEGFNEAENSVVASEAATVDLRGTDDSVEDI
jgi:hypothetical protein